MKKIIIIISSVIVALGVLLAVNYSHVKELYYIEDGNNGSCSYDDELDAYVLWSEEDKHNTFIKRKNTEVICCLDDMNYNVYSLIERGFILKTQKLYIYTK